MLTLGTSERVCLISGSVDGILRIHEFIMEKIKEKPDPNAKMAIDFDHKQPAEREKQVCLIFYFLLLSFYRSLCLPTRCYTHTSNRPHAYSPFLPFDVNRLKYWFLIVLRV